MRRRSGCRPPRRGPRASGARGRGQQPRTWTRVWVARPLATGQRAALRGPGRRPDRGPAGSAGRSSGRTNAVAACGWPTSSATWCRSGSGPGARRSASTAGWTTVGPIRVTQSAASLLGRRLRLAHAENLVDLSGVRGPGCAAATAITSPSSSISAARRSSVRRVSSPGPTWAYSERDVAAGCGMTHRDHLGAQPWSDRLIGRWSRASWRPNLLSGACVLV